MPRGSVMISGSEPIRFKKQVMDADGVSPVVQLMSMLREIVERLRMQDAQADNGNVQEVHANAQAQAQGDAAPVVEAVPTPAENQVGQSSSAQPTPDSVPTTM
jgi:hypothetical protein